MQGLSGINLSEKSASYSWTDDCIITRSFGLNKILGLNGEKNRNNHRHHAIDACVIGVTDQGLLQQFAKASSRAEQLGLERLVEVVPYPWKTFREHVLGREFLKSVSSSGSQS